jgi:predicted SnoaL-like aldol condensation-catalyzing enzyme
MSVWGMSVPCCSGWGTNAFDTFRLQDGKIAEHWDDATIPTTGPMARLMRTPVSTIY